MLNRKSFIVYSKKVLLCTLILWIGILLLLTLLPGDSFPRLPQFMDLFSPDKIMHLFMYGTLQYLLFKNLLIVKKFSLKKSTLVSFSISIPVAALTEILQGILPIKRSMSQYDFIANVVGILIVTFILYKKNKTTNIVKRNSDS